MEPRKHSIAFHSDWFTLAELIVVIAILTILATIGFLGLQTYSQDAKIAAVKANVVSVHSAITAESTVSGNSPRYYVVHDSAAALTGAVAYVDWNPVFLSGGDWDQDGTNYSAGNPDWRKLKLDPMRFRLSAKPEWVSAAHAAYDSHSLLVGAMDSAATANWKARTVSYFQIAGISPTNWATVVSWNYPASSGSVAGLLKDPNSTSSTWALVNWRKSVLALTTGDCAPSTQAVNGKEYSVPATPNGSTALVVTTSSVTWGIQSYSQSFSCSNGSVSVNGSESTEGLACTASWYAAISGSCVPNACKSIKAAYPASPDWSYFIDPDGSHSGFGLTSAYCDMTTDGGGWTLVGWNKGVSNAVGTGFFVTGSNLANVANKTMTNSAASLGAEAFSRLANTSGAMLKSAAYSSTPIIDNSTGNWDYDTVRCGWTLSHTSRTAGCPGYNANDNWEGYDRFNVAIGQQAIVPYYRASGNELCYSGKGWCDFEFYLR